MTNSFSLDELFLFDRQSSFVIRLTGKTPRLGFAPRDFVIVNRALKHEIGRPALTVIQGKFQVRIVDQELIQHHDPENGDFIWGMIQTLVRELE